MRCVVASHRQKIEAERLTREMGCEQNTAFCPRSRALDSSLREQWAYVLREQRFYLRSPSMNGPAIEQALNSDETGIGFIAKLVIALEPAVHHRLDESFRRFLLSE
jgi:hypothetical protein